MGWLEEMQERCERRRTFDEAFWSAYPGGGWQYECFLLDIAYAGHDEAEGPLTHDQALAALAERAAREEAAGKHGAVLVRVLHAGFTRDSVLHSRHGVFDFSCCPVLASCLGMDGGMMTAGCGNSLSDSRDSRWKNPAAGPGAWRQSHLRREGRQAWFASLGTTSDEGLASMRPWTPEKEPSA